jgi:hypothetical protein
MNNPWSRLKWLPWRSLILVSVLTILIAMALDFLLVLGLTQSAIIRDVLVTLLSPPWSLVAIAAAGVGIGALAVYLFERLYGQVLINTSTLWTLILCLILGLGLKSLLPLSGILVGLNYTQMIGILVGVFWKGRRYWR